MTDRITQIVYRMLAPLVRLLVRMHVTPNGLTTAGLAVNFVAAIVLITGGELGARGDMAYIGWASALILFAGLFDILDGQVARGGGMETTFGGIYDSVVDRYSELIMFLGMCYYLVSHGFFLTSLLSFVAMIGSVMVSYTRARAEGAGLTCKTGIMQRPARIVLIGAAGIVCAASTALTDGYVKIRSGDPLFGDVETIALYAIPIGLVAFFSNVTAIGRLRHCHAQLAGK
ncbi:MAG: CDP-alcohol phosphatidyltransferase family protein [Bacteroidetes bacterium]|nr:CDP-alcohol phosphatidyltransferase family protein [Bacteroidota bacterium]